MSHAGFKNTYLNHKFNPDPYVNIDWLIKTVDKQLISSNQDQIRQIMINSFLGMHIWDSSGYFRLGNLRVKKKGLRYIFQLG